MRGKTIHHLGIAVMWLGGINLIGAMAGYFTTTLFFYIFLVLGWMIVRAGCSMMEQELESNPEMQKVLKLLSDERYEAGLKMAVEDSRNNPEPEHKFERAVFFLEQQGIPRDEAEANLRMICAVLSEAAPELEILRVENL